LTVGDGEVPCLGPYAGLRNRIAMRPECEYRVVSSIGKCCAVRPAVDGYRRIRNRRASVTSGDDKMRSTLLGRGAPGKPEVADARPPVKGGSSRVVLVGVVEGAIVHRINGDIGVIAPSV
jgi:hypothetical protein